MKMTIFANPKRQKLNSIYSQTLKFKVMKKVSMILLGTALLMGLASCGSKQKVVSKNGGEVEIEMPCTGPEYRTDATHFRATGTALSTDRQVAKDKALMAARAELATEINTTMERVTDRYNSSYNVGEDDETRGKFQDLARQLVKQTLSGSVVTCEKLTKDEQGGKYHFYVCVELKGDDFANKLKNGISNDDKLRTDYEYEKFKKVFDEEMAKME